ncbi:hypothetical protein [Nocardiopsis aegyptia]|uniref:LppX_LprAFG lipoprotein n=1 Tax=Nocardiopsis aegyptia TaxID=220378 RepID=A0A7Z0JAJ1_9ACTN|nr:hypothetical protein [Nocardiopsis aegyptia]NYJ34459.1 hypothetical protein [Nocardiopsis aegyptia]
MKTLKPGLVAAGSLTLALALSACGAPEEEAAATPSDAPAEEGGNGGTGVLDLLGDLASRTEAVDNYTLDMDITSSDPELGETEMTMTYEVMADPQAAQVTMYMPAMGEMLAGLAELGGPGAGLSAEELSTSILIVPAEGEMLVSNHNGLQEVDTAWARGTAGEGQQPASENMFDTSNLPKVAGAVASIETIEETGTEEIDGVSTTVLEGSFTSEELDALDAEQRSALDELVGGATGAMDVAIWISDDGFPMRMDFSDEVSSISMVYSLLGETSFEMPAEEEITDL